MNHNGVPKLTIVGHIAIDKIITDGGVRIQLGGPPTYTAATARLLGLGIDAITKIGGDLPEELKTQLETLGLKPIVVEGAETTRFILDYRGGERRLSVEAICDAIEPWEIGGLGDAVMLSPIIGEVHRETALKLRRAETLALDPQGYLRALNPDGSVELRPWLDLELLSSIDIYKSTMRELRLITGVEEPLRALRRLNELGVGEAIATLGDEGAILSLGDEAYWIPAYRVEAVDPTGAGDVYLAAYLSERLRGGEPTWCGAIASATASLIVETVGASFKASREELQGRAYEIYEGVKRLPG